MSEIEVDYDPFLVDGEEFERAGLWDQACYEFELESIEKRTDQEIRGGDYEGEKYDSLNLRFRATQKAIYDDEGQFTGDIEPATGIRFMELPVNGPYKKLNVYGALCERILGSKDGGMKDSTTGRYSLSDIADSLIGNRVWNVISHFQYKRGQRAGQWADSMSNWFPKEPPRKIKIS